MKKETCMSELSSYIDFGMVFADGGGVCDFSACLTEIANFLPAVAGLAGRQIEEHESRLCEVSLRRQYLERHPFAHGADKDTAVYCTPWRQQNGIPICIRVTLLKRDSLKILDANKKMTLFEVCEPSGNPVGTLRSLPWLIDNLRDIAFAVRACMRHRFVYDLLGPRLVSQWKKAGASEELPCTLFIGETADGDDLYLRFSPSENGDSADGRVHVVAKLVVDDTEIPLQALLPPMFRFVNPNCFNREAFEDFTDIVGAAVFTIQREWRTIIRQRYDFLALFQSGRGKSPGIIPVELDGFSGEVFHTGTWTEQGEAVYGLCRDRGSDGRWTNIVWLLGEHLEGLGVTDLPAAPDWDAEKSPFNIQRPMAPLSPHILDHASRWADPDTLTGERDDVGHDIFITAAARDEMFGRACEELKTSLLHAAFHPEDVGFGYYHSAVDRVRGECSPITTFLPGFFEKTPTGKTKPRAVFVLRVRTASKFPFYEVPTILSLPMARLSALVLGGDIPPWMSGEGVSSFEDRKAS